MNQRNYNIFFHLHTVSGIVISVALFIIFFAGGFALIKDEITAWEKGDPVFMERVLDINYDQVIAAIEKEGYHLEGRDIRMLMPDVKQEMLVVLSGSKYPDASDQDKNGAYFNVNTLSYKISEYYSFYSFGELMYRFHFFHQIPYGIYLAGLVAFFFLFAIISGVFLHWDKIVSNFFLFRPGAKLKTVWTDAHTVLGILGLPFQFVFAVTSCFLCLSVFILIPGNVLYKNNQSKLLEDLRPWTQSYPIEGKSEEAITLNPFMEQTLQQWKDFAPVQVYIKNYGDKNMQFQVDGLLDPSQKFLGPGRIVYNTHSGTVISKTDPMNASYLESVELAIRKLHFGDFGGIWIKMLYFVMAMLTCFVIITGVLIWLEARNKKHIPERRKKFNKGVGYTYLAICLSLFPITAISFIVSKLIPREMNDLRRTILYWVFFGGWILLTFTLRLVKNNYLTNKYTLITGTFFGYLIPVVNGAVSGNWIWKTLADRQYSIFLIDTFWIVLASVSLFAIFKLRKDKAPEVSG